MPKINEKDLAERYASYVTEVKRIKKEEKETEKRAIQMAALNMRVSEDTIKKALVYKSK